MLNQDNFVSNLLSHFYPVKYLHFIKRFIQHQHLLSDAPWPVGYSPLWLPQDAAPSAVSQSFSFNIWFRKYLAVTSKTYFQASECQLQIFYLPSALIEMCYFWLLLSPANLTSVLACQSSESVAASCDCRRAATSCHKISTKCHKLNCQHIVVGINGAWIRVW